jgi:hypothetical protein
MRKYFGAKNFGGNYFGWKTEFENVPVERAT